MNAFVRKRGVNRDIRPPRFHRAQKGDQHDGADVLDVGERQAAADHHAGPDQQQIAQIMPRAKLADRQRGGRGSEQRRGGDDPDLERIVAGFAEIGGQYDDGKTIAEATHRARCVEPEVMTNIITPLPFRLAC